MPSSEFISLFGDMQANHDSVQPIFDIRDSKTVDNENTPRSDKDAVMSKQTTIIPKNI